MNATATVPDHRVGFVPMLIGGSEVEAASGRTLSLLNPATGRPIATVPAGDAEDVDRAVHAARDAFDNGPWPKLSIQERSRLLNRFADALEDRLDDLFRLETQNNGRPVIETRAQLGRLAEWYRYFAGLLLAQRTRDVARAHRVTGRIEAGMVCSVTVRTAADDVDWYADDAPQRLN